MALEQQKGISALDDRSRLDKIRDFMAEAAQSQTRAAQAKQEALQTIQPTAAQTAYLGSVFAPGAGTIDAAGNFPAFPGSDVALQDAFSGEPMPSMAENIKAGGIDRYLMAPLQGLGVVGDAAYGIPVAGPGIAAALKLPAALATVAGGIAKASKAKKVSHRFTADPQYAYKSDGSKKQIGSLDNAQLSFKSNDGSDIVLHTKIMEPQGVKSGQHTDINFEFDIYRKLPEGEFERIGETRLAATNKSSLKDGFEFTGLEDIRFDSNLQGQGLGTEIIEAIGSTNKNIAKGKDPLKIYSITKEARPFWEKIGSTDFKPGVSFNYNTGDNLPNAKLFFGQKENKKITKLKTDETKQLFSGIESTQRKSLDEYNNPILDMVNKRPELKTLSQEALPSKDGIVSLFRVYNIGEGNKLLPEAGVASLSTDITPVMKIGSNMEYKSSGGFSPMSLGKEQPLQELIRPAQIVRYDVPVDRIQAHIPSLIDSLPANVRKAQKNESYISTGQKEKEVLADLSGIEPAAVFDMPYQSPTTYYKGDRIIGRGEELPNLGVFELFEQGKTPKGIMRDIMKSGSPDKARFTRKGDYKKYSTYLDEVKADELNPSVSPPIVQGGATDFQKANPGTSPYQLYGPETYPMPLASRSAAKEDFANLNKLYQQYIEIKGLGSIPPRQ